MPLSPWQYAIALGDSTADCIREQWTRDQGPTAVVKFRCPWNLRYPLMRTLLGAWGNSPPAVYPDGSNSLYCLDITDCRPIGGVTYCDFLTGFPTFEKAELVAFFGIPPYDWPGVSNDISGEPWLVTTFEVTGEMLSLPEGSLYWEGSTLPVHDARVGKFIGQIGVRFKRKWADQASALTMLKYVGKVNKGDFELGGFKAADQTLLFLGGPMERTVNTRAEWTQDVELNFVYRPKPHWNQLWHPVAGTGFKAIQNQASSTDADDRLFERADFRPLFD